MGGGLRLAVDMQSTVGQSTAVVLICTLILKSTSCDWSAKVLNPTTASPAAEFQVIFVSNYKYFK